MRLPALITDIFICIGLMLHYICHTRMFGLISATFAVTTLAYFLLLIAFTPFLLTPILVSHFDCSLS